MQIGGSDGGLEFAAIGENVFGGVPFHEAEIEDVLGFKRACTAGAGAEAVDEPGEFRERQEFEDLEALGFAKAPGEEMGARADVVRLEDESLFAARDLRRDDFGRGMRLTV